MRKVFLIEPNLSGHHAMYLKYFVDTLLALDCQVTIYCRDIDETKQLFPSPAIEKKLAFIKITYLMPFSLSGKKKTKKLFVILNLLLTVLNLWTLKKKRVKISGSYFFCCVDDYLNDLLPLSWFKYLLPLSSWGGMTLLSNNPKGISAIDRRKLFNHPGCKGIGVLGNPSQTFLHLFKNKIVPFPDFTDTASPNLEFDLAQRMLQQAQGRKIISLLGLIAGRKGIKTFIETIKLVDTSKYFFIIAGGTALTTDEELLIKTTFITAPNTLYHPYVIPDEADFNALIYYSDILYAAYVDFHGSSNMFSKASLFRRPLIVSKGLYMEEVINQYQLGLAINSDSSEQCAEAMAKLTSIEFIQKLDPQFDAYLEKNSVKGLKETFPLLLSKIS